MADELSRADEAALVALRREEPVPRWALPSLERLLVKGFLHREGLTDAGVKRADALISTLNGLGAMIRKPHRYGAQRTEEARSWTR